MIARSTLLVSAFLALSAASPAQSNLPVATAALARSDALAVDWLNRQAIPLQRVEPEGGLDDLRPLKQVFTDVRVVGLGEATHGTREFFQVKHRLVEFLVQEMDFNVFALEANFATCLQIDNYISGGKIRREEALQNLGFPVWQTEEVAALLDWLRTHNQSAPLHRKVRFYGCDMQDMGGVWEVFDYVKRVAPEKSGELRGAITNLVAATQAAFGGARENLKALRPEVDQWIAYFVRQEPEFIQKTSRADYETTLHRLRLLAQATDVFSQEWNGTRDRFLAQNVLDRLTSGGPDTRMIVWAHNSHIATGELNSTPGARNTMGNYLRRQLGTAYYALGLAFSEGSFQAMASAPGNDTPFVEYTVGPAGTDSLNWFFAQATSSNYVVNFRQSPKPEAVQKWLTTPRPFGWVGGYNVPSDLKDSWATGNFLKTELGKEYDGMVFIKRTTRARPLAKEKR